MVPTDERAAKMQEPQIPTGASALGVVISLVSVSRTARGTSAASTTRWRLQPARLFSVGFGPVRSPPFSARSPSCQSLPRLVFRTETEPTIAMMSAVASLRVLPERGMCPRRLMSRGALSAPSHSREHRAPRRHRSARVKPRRIGQVRPFDRNIPLGCERVR